MWVKLNTLLKVKEKYNKVLVFRPLTMYRKSRVIPLLIIPIESILIIVYTCRQIIAKQISQMTGYFHFQLPTGICDLIDILWKFIYLSIYGTRHSIGTKQHQRLDLNLYACQ